MERQAMPSGHEPGQRFVGPEMITRSDGAFHRGFDHLPIQHAVFSGNSVS
jgi:hypothetical protein